MKLDHQKLQREEPELYAEIFQQNVYGVNRSEIEGKVVFDIGANVGYFTLQCIELAAKHIISVEAQPFIFEAGLLQNVKESPLVTPINRAVMNVDRGVVHIPNLHHGSKIGAEGDPVVTTTLDSLVEQYGVHEDMVLKLDVEGSEFDILLSSSAKTMRRFNVLYMELHGGCHSNPAYQDIHLITTFLDNCGFECIRLLQSEGWGIRDGVKVTDSTLLPIVIGKWIKH